MAEALLVGRFVSFKFLGVGEKRLPFRQGRSCHQAKPFGIATTVTVTAVQIAFSWLKAFAEAASAWIGAHRDSIDRIGGAVGSGLGQMTGGMFQQAGDFFRNLPRRRGQ
ncbi:hypothetical protein [Verrucomicrobium sp. 3C]|uniref:hypothetical protein n=1 Tax=Verrucomicrobium sp. 3C TaxID=1134055 RepID=UPI00036E532F|nr:hypothetical protein [Verrucomicrobium sp. 3C]